MICNEVLWQNSLLPRKSQWDPLGLMVQHKTERKAISSNCWNVLKPGERHSYPILLKQMQPGFIILNWRQKGNPWNGTIFNFHRRKNSVSRQGNDHCLLGLWRSNSCGCNAEKGDNQFWHLYQDTHRTQETFQMSLASQESNRNLASAWQCKTTHKSEDSGSHHKIWLDSVIPSILQPWSSSLKFPPIERPEECSTWYEVWDWWCDSRSQNLATWAGQGMASTRHAWMHLFLVSHKVATDFVDQVKPSLFTLCHLHVEINIYWKKMGH